MVNGNESPISGRACHATPFADEIALGCALVDETSEWLDETYADVWRAPPGVPEPASRMLPATVLPAADDGEDLYSLAAAADVCKLAPTAMDDGLDFGGWLADAVEEAAGCFSGADSDSSAEEFAALFEERIVPVSAPVTLTPKMPPPVVSPAKAPRVRTAVVPRPRRSGRRSRSGGRRRVAELPTPPKALKVRKAGVQQFDESRSRAEMRDIVKQFGVQSSEARRHQHNILERKRRCDLKSSYESLRVIVPSVTDTARCPTGQILIAAIEYIRELQRQDKELMSTLRSSRDENRRLKQLVHGSA